MIVHSLSSAPAISKEKSGYFATTKTTVHNVNGNHVRIRIVSQTLMGRFVSWILKPARTVLGLRGIGKERLYYEGKIDALFAKILPQMKTVNRNSVDRAFRNAYCKQNVEPLLNQYRLLCVAEGTVPINSKVLLEGLSFEAMLFKDGEMDFSRFDASVSEYKAIVSDAKRFDPVIETRNRLLDQITNAIKEISSSFFPLRHQAPYWKTSITNEITRLTALKEEVNQLFFQTAPENLEEELNRCQNVLERLKEELIPVAEFLDNPFITHRESLIAFRLKLLNYVEKLFCHPQLSKYISRKGEEFLCEIIRKAGQGSDAEALQALIGLKGDISKYSTCETNALVEQLDIASYQYGIFLEAVPAEDKVGARSIKLLNDHQAFMDQYTEALSKKHQGTLQKIQQNYMHKRQVVLQKISEIEHSIDPQAESAILAQSLTKWCLKQARLIQTLYFHRDITSKELGDNIIDYLRTQLYPSQLKAYAPKELLDAPAFVSFENDMAQLTETRDSYREAIWVVHDLIHAVKNYYLQYPKARKSTQFNEWYHSVKDIHSLLDTLSCI